jgi:glutathione S-transferase
LFHLVHPSEWAVAVEDGAYRPASLDTEGFVHFSYADQVAGSANRHYADAPELVVVEVDADRLDAPLRVEDSYGSGTAFPHVYGPIPVAAAVAVHPLRRDVDGAWTFNAPPVT